VIEAVAACDAQSGQSSQLEAQTIHRLQSTFNTLSLANHSLFTPSFFIHQFDSTDRASSSVVGRELTSAPLPLDLSDQFLSTI
jgi:hypothetical protein